MRILAFEPYYGGSHKAFLDQWIERSNHDWELLTLPPHHWKWRMRHAGIWGAQQVIEWWRDGRRWDLFFTSDMLDLAQFAGLASEAITRIPRVAYFHENQLTYPDRYAGERDLHFALTNFTTCLAADQVWFNSEYHRTVFLKAVREWLDGMPDFVPVAQLESVEAGSQVQSPGIDVQGLRRTARVGPLRIAWAARWEHDKNPTTFFESLRILKERRLPFRLTVCGEQFREVPAEFTQARAEFADHIDHWGYLPSRRDYLLRLSEADVFVSTAIHEFFGLAVLESIALGLVPLLPNRLSYPELLGRDRGSDALAFLYDGSAVDLAERLARLAQDPDVTRNDSQNRLLQDTANRYAWPLRAQVMDDALECELKKS